MKTQKLFSKREKTDKYTTMGDDSENVKDVLGMPKNNKKKLNSKAKKKLEEDEENKKYENEFKDNRIVMEKVSDTTLKNANDLEELQKKTLILQNRLKKLKQDLIDERNLFIKDINVKDSDLNQKALTLKKLSSKYNKNIELLRNIEQKLTLKESKYKKKKRKNEQEIKKEITLIESQIKKFEERAILAKDNYNNSIKRAEQKENLENDLKEELTVINKEISELKNTIKELKKIDVEHKHCKLKNKQMFEELKSLNETYQYELKKAKQLALSEITELKNENNEKEEDHEEVEDDDVEKALVDEKNFLPKIKNIKFSVSPTNKLESKIIQKNKIGLKNSKSNTFNLFKRINDEYNNNNRYIIEANKNIRLNNINQVNNSNFITKTEGNYLFDEYESKVMKKILPENFFNSIQSKYDSICNQKKEIQEKLKNETKEIKYENSLINNKREFNSLKVKETKQNYTILNHKYYKLNEKINIIKAQIKEAEKQIQKEEKKLKKYNLGVQSMQMYFKGSPNNEQKNNKTLHET